MAVDPAFHASPHPRKLVVVTQRLFGDEATAYLQAAGCDVLVPEISRQAGDGHLSRETLLNLLRGAAGWIIGQARVERDLLVGCPDLVVLSRRGVGYDRIDIQAAAALGRVVTIAAGGNHDAVADHTMALMLSVLRRLRESQRSMEGGSWAALVGGDLTGKTVGLVGFGRIAQAVLKRLSGFDVTVLVDADGGHGEAIAAAGARPVDRRTLLAESDVVSLHAPSTAATRHMIDETAIVSMKPSAIIINTARGGLIRDASLLDALRDGRLAGAGLDVFASESDPSLDGITAALVAHPKVVATPHAAASSREAIALCNRIASDNVLAVLAGGTPPLDRVVVDGRRAQAIP